MRNFGIDIALRKMGPAFAHIKAKIHSYERLRRVFVSTLKMDKTFKRLDRLWCQYFEMQNELFLLIILKTGKQ